MSDATIEQLFQRWCRGKGYTSEQYINDQREAFFAGYNCKKGQENRAQADTTPTDPLQCPNCESFHVAERTHLDTFRYGLGANAVLLGVQVPLLFCRACDQQWTDHRGEELREACVKAYLQTGIP